MNNLIQLITNAMIREEGMGPTYTNPGNLRGAPWRYLDFPTIANGGIINGFWKPASREMGIAGLAHVVALHVAQGNTIRDFIAGHPGVYAGFAPGADHNKPDEYIKNVIQWVKEGWTPTGLLNGKPYVDTVNHVKGIAIEEDKPMLDYIIDEIGFTIEIKLPT